MNLDLGHLKRTEGDICEYFSRCGTRTPNQGLVFLCVLLSSNVGIEILEDFIETVLEHALKRVADEGGAEAFPDTSGTLFADEGAETGGEALVLRWVDLGNA